MTQPAGSGSVSPNFWFLAQHDAALLRAASSAEQYVFDDPNTALFKLRQLAEIFAKGVASRLGLPLAEGDDFALLERRLRDAGLLDHQLHQVMRTVRRLGNSAAHSLAGERRDALHSLKLVRQLAIWFHKTTKRDAAFRAGPFVPPDNPADAEDELRQELEQLRARLKQREQSLDELQQYRIPQLQQQAADAVREAGLAYADAEAALELGAETEAALQARIAQYEAGLVEAAAENAEADTAEKQQVTAAASQASVDLELDEWDTRQIIDGQLQDAGWEADSSTLRYSNGIRPVKHRNLAIAEWPTATGPADYVLFRGLTPLAVVEAKRAIKNVAGAIEQAKRYSRDFRVEAEQESPGGPWGDFQVPFLFATNGRPYLRQLLEKSGVWYLDARRETNHPRALESWYTPDGLWQLLQQDIQAADQRLEAEPADYLPLRDYQKDAVRAVERQIAAGSRSMLIAMATGTGKTITCIGLVYRLIKAKRFRRVLFLVDRTSLGEQAADKLKDVRLENLQTFPDIYDVKQLGDLKPDTDTKLQIATIQGMVKRLLYAEDEAPVPVDWYDCIVVDECHRGYNLDQEMSDGELRFRDESDYISKYRRVIDHFDAVKIGLTATPALHTTDIFGRPVFNYSYRQAVIDGHLSDHDPPFRLVTRLNEDGMRWQRGAEMKIYDARTHEVELYQTPDDVAIEVDQFNRSVVTENFNRTVCQTLAEHIDPDLPGKTLIFCVNDLHADLVVRLLKEAFDQRYGGVPDAAVEKITGASDKPLQLIRRYKNEQLPKVAVTVDLLTTGIDVPAITTLVFIRRVRSRILFDQMLGRATRLCDSLYGTGEHKDRFQIFDAVDIYNALEPLTEMKPVVTRPNITFAQLAKELLEVDDAEFRGQVRDEFIAKLRRKNLSDQQVEQLGAACGMDQDQLIEHAQASDPEQLGRWLADRPAVSDILDAAPRGAARLIISEHEDELRRVERGYGTASRPDDYLEAFRTFLEQNLDEIPALVVVAQRPRDLTRAQLRELRGVLDQEGFTEANLRTAIRETTNKDVAASIIGYILHVACGQPLIAHKDRVKAAMDQVLASRRWTEPQRKWLERIGKQLEQETIVDRESLDAGQFRQAGGFQRLNKVFQGELDQILKTIADAMWQTAA